MKNPTANSSEEVTLFDLWQILVRRKWWVLLVPFLAVIAAVVAITLIKPQWEATAVIRVGAVGQMGEEGKEGKEVLIEPVARAVERVKLRAFGNEVLADLGYPLDEKSPEARLYRASLNVRALPDADVIAVTVRGYSREGAGRAAEATVAYLRKTHDELAAPSVQRARQLLAETEREITETKAEIEKLRTPAVKGKPFAEGAFMQSVVVTNIMDQRNRELRELERLKTFYEEQLGPLRTYPTSLIEKTSVDEEPVTPKKALIILLAGLMGLIVGVIVAFVAPSDKRMM